MGTIEECEQSREENKKREAEAANKMKRQFIFPMSSYCVDHQHGNTAHNSILLLDK